MAEENQRAAARRYAPKHMPISLRQPDLKCEGDWPGAHQVDGCSGVVAGDRSRSGLPRAEGTGLRVAADPYEGAEGMPLGDRAQATGSEAPHGHDAALVAAAQRGDAQALEALWARHRGWLAAILLRHKPASADVEDLLQDVAAQLVAKLHTITDPGALPGWLRTTAVNAARWAGRKQSVRQRAGEVRGIDAHDAAEQTAAPGWSASAHGGSDDRDTHEASGVSAQSVLDLARQLPPEYAEPLLLRAMQELTYTQIAQILGLPESTIETRIARGRRMLRQAALRGSVEGVRVRG